MGAGHDHGAEQMSDGRLVGAIAINGLLTVAQIVAGVLSGSLALIADALHNLSDAASLVIALIARRIGRRPADRLMTFGYARAEVVAALINLVSLLLIGVYLLAEAIGRALNPQPIDGWPVVIVAGVALVIDVATAAMIHKGSKHSLNIRAAFLHNVSDALASVGVIVAGVLILWYDLVIADLIVTAVIAGYIIWQGLTLMPRTLRLLMGAVPDALDYDAVVDALRRWPGVSHVHHVHVWSLDEHRHALEAHIAPRTTTLEAFDLLKRELKSMLRQRFGVAHTTLEACLSDPGPDAMRECGGTDHAHAHGGHDDHHHHHHEHAHAAH